MKDFKLKEEDAGNREGKHEGTDAKRCFVVVDEDYDDDDD